MIVPDTARKVEPRFAETLLGREVTCDTYGYQPHFLRNKIGVVVDRFGNDTCHVRFEIDGQQVILSIAARDLCPVAGGVE